MDIVKQGKIGFSEIFRDIFGGFLGFLGFLGIFRIFLGFLRFFCVFFGFLAFFVEFFFQAQLSCVSSFDDFSSAARLRVVL